ncbi:hypothetical protein Lfu02_22800 [Longispora fulva]|uniref:Uncharacterized protein n=1 Tax=Longispora fulva TaxID=619741 RepID=A0A8J7GXN1_9ACTN|nr:hypothetical protein [Longispora fulva]GIG57908.1 hypothetical protein Lfu02_22800 [Longispora fulva]
MTVYYSVFATAGAELLQRCRYEGQGLAVLADAEALQTLRLAGGRDGRLIAVRCEPCGGWHMRPRVGHEK